VSPLIRTVLGDVPSSNWGPTNCHAHLVNDLSTHHHDDRYSDFALTIEQTSSELVEFREAGGFALVELTPMGLGRDPRAVAAEAAASGVQVVLGAGIYHEAFHPAEIAGLDESGICDLLIREICEGIADTGIRAGVIGEQGSYMGRISAREADVFRASARAAIETGVALSTHTHAGELALEQLDLLERAGLPLDRVIVGHLDDRSPLDIALQLEVARRGAWVQYDDIGFDYFTQTLNVQMPTDAERLRGISELMEAGYLGRIVLGSDLCKPSHLRAHGGPGLAHLVGGFRTQARSAGFSEDELHQLLTVNPATVLALH
jgi:predicted metal-dependent phosphotriesterase family hydrolase